MLSEQANLRKQFESEASEAKLALRQMLDQVAAMKKLVGEAEAADSNDSTDVDHDENNISRKLDSLDVGEREAVRPKPDDEEYDTLQRKPA